VIFSLRISSNKFRENPTYEHLYFSGGLPPAQNDLGVMYYLGHGVTRNNTRAYMWFYLSASGGDKGAMVNLDRLQNRMTPTDIIKGKQLADECAAKNYKGC